MKGRIGVLVATMVLAGPALAGHRDWTDAGYGRVVDVRPLVDYVTVDRPRRECWNELAYAPTRGPRSVRDAAPLVAGSALGGAIANELSHGSGPWTLVGAVAGAALANEVVSDGRHERGSRRDSRAVTVERCRTVHERVVEERIVAYDVSYRYLGRRYRMRTLQPPGRVIRVSGIGVAHRH